MSTCMRFPPKLSPSECVAPTDCLTLLKFTTVRVSPSRLQRPHWGRGERLSWSGFLFPRHRQTAKWATGVRILCRDGSYGKEGGGVTHLPSNSTLDNGYGKLGPF
ncbi:hypothetical protein, unlikely [Trypanosoma brucei gambiense DAL972]|uniref:Uncharacterized protein n=1 Tax=Trypanosoma brucei gambiense (strain MHOM/CI/86/DAL972) TaxID=679716 RepID=D0A4N1_TRYB9|nr:hypothetical protein, unlikely [Trypanosoma brucei gambiense DAL972]CBH16225.1 hypothetical protein, unlikely [Trypanosoma brucei gambiense DAL972]|eukprot:XP_011778489.1 hypothetical protein, unlikely [Trypanosoma brucei gambiense DAL972]